jgi:uncharacterized protein YkwD
MRPKARSCPSPANAWQLFAKIIAAAPNAAGFRQQLAQKLKQPVRLGNKGCAMKTPRLLAVLALSIAMVVPAASHARSCDVPANMDELRAQMMADVNAERAARGLSALRMNGDLVQAAQGHACDNAKRQTYTHVSSDGSQLQHRLRRAGYSYAMANENTGMGFASTQRAVAWWMNSPYHRDNILMRGTRDIGVGIAFSDAPDSRLYWVINMGATR